VHVLQPDGKKEGIPLRFLPGPYVVVECLSFVCLQLPETASCSTRGWCVDQDEKGVYLLLQGKNKAPAQERIESRGHLLVLLAIIT